MIDVTIIEAIERLGGWAVVVWIVVWLTKRWEHKMNEILDVGRAQHDSALDILRNQNDILDELRRDQKEIAKAVKGLSA